MQWKKCKISKCSIIYSIYYERIRQIRLCYRLFSAFLWLCQRYNVVVENVRIPAALCHSAVLSRLLWKNLPRSSVLQRALLSCLKQPCSFLWGSMWKLGNASTHCYFLENNSIAWKTTPIEGTNTESINTILFVMEASIKLCLIKSFLFDVK